MTGAGRRGAAGLFAALLAGAAAAEGRLTPLDPADWPPDIVEQPRAPAPGAYVEGLVETHEGGDIRRAWYDAPTERYAHGALGDPVEAGRLVVETAAGARLTLDLPPAQVFEDIHPRLADLDGDGTVELVTIRASTTGGAAVAVYGLEGGRLVETAATPPIGRPNRWLNIAAIAPFLGGAGREIAYVETPHIGGVLRLWRYHDGRLTPLGALPGFSNHVYGARELRLSAVIDIDGDGRPELALPDERRRALKLVAFGAAGPRVVARTPLPAAVDKAIGAGGGRPILGLADGAVVSLAP